MEGSEQIGQQENQVNQAGESATKKKRSSDAEGDVGVVRLKLGGAVGAKIREVVAELKGRGVSVTGEELLADYLENIPDRYFEAQFLKWTPERYYIEAAIELPGFREKLVRQAKRSLGLLAAKNSEESSVPRRKRREQSSTGETAQEG